MQTRGLSRGIGCFIAVCLLIGECVVCGTVCAYSKKSFIRVSVAEKSSWEEGEPPLTGELLEGNQTERCQATRFCYALWQEDFSNTTVVVAQGCWSATEFDCGEEGACVSNKRPPMTNLRNTTTKFCCCTGDLCNANVSDGASSLASPFSPSDAPRLLERASPYVDTVVIAVTAVCSLAILVALAACFAYHVCAATRKAGPDSVCLMEPPLPPSPALDLDSLKIGESIGRGRYGHVFRGTLRGQPVAVKVFSSQHRQNFVNERHVYLLPFMDHTALPKLIGAEERTGADERPEYLLVLSYAPNGCLQDYLTNNTIDWSTFCKMAQSITQGLAHLHMEIRKEDKVKMCVVHRDLTSRNILIKSDGSSCMLCDFEFAICVSGSKYYINGEEQIAESTSLMDVGTLRYMAPEVLEGAVNLRDCESSLKQIDVYALGLIVWELAMRCTELFQGVEVPEYKAPFVAEIGNHPTMEQMQVLVAKHKARPLFPDIWKATNPAVRALKETIDDCWDQDAEARLTALCVEERLIELPVLWDRHKAGTAIQGVSPTVNPTTSQSRPSATVQTSSNGWCKGSAFEMPVMRSNSDALSPTNWASSDSRYSGDFSMSENTAETSVTMSPTELTPKSCPSNSSSNGYNLKNLVTNNNITPGLKVTVPLQPYQGKNPIMERNLIMEPAEDVTVNGNSLVERGDKFSTRNNSANSFNLDTDLFNTLQTGEASESNALVPNDILSHSTRAVNPIPYVQNAVHVVSTMPKQPNVPGNGHSLQMANGHGGGIKKKHMKEKGIMVGFRNFFKLSRSAPLAEQPNPTVPKPMEVPRMTQAFNNPPPTVNVPKLCNVHSTVPKPLGITNLTKTQSMDTEVYIMDPNDEFSMTQTVVRPVANRQVYCQTVPVEDTCVKSNFMETKRPSYQNGFVQSQTHPQLCSENNPRMKRPSTLPVTSYENAAAALLPSPAKVGSESNISRCRQETDETSSNVSKSMRFSLYDDRIMTSNPQSYQQIQNTPCKLGSPHISASVPLSIDSLCESEVTSFHETFQPRNFQTKVYDKQ